jgi:hypothetical protein
MATVYRNSLSAQARRQPQARRPVELGHERDRLISVFPRAVTWVDVINLGFEPHSLF